MFSYLRRGWYFLPIGLLVCVFSVPITSLAADFEVAGWVPWWQDTMGTKSATKNIGSIDTLYPFAYEVNTSGHVVDKANFSEKQWKKLKQLAEKNDVTFVPSIAWFDGEAIHDMLSNTSSRTDHIEEIVELVEDNDFDGIDIDYESRLADTIDYYSLFLKELSAALDEKELRCTLEARTPPESLYTDVPKNIRYSNDYEEIAKYCDVVEIMAYDQQRADLKLNRSKNGEPYIPVADADWVEKVVKLAIEDIPSEKILLGTPTYGRQWTVTVEPDWFKSYANVSALNLPDAKSLAKDHKVKLGTNKAGEQSFSFIPDTEPKKKQIAKMKVPKGTRKGMEAAMQALAYANKTGETVTVRVVWISDAKAIAEKIDLIEQYNLRGIALFKIDGEEDPKIWKLLK